MLNILAKHWQKLVEELVTTSLNMGTVIRVMQNSTQKKVLMRAMRTGLVALCRLGIGNL